MATPTESGNNAGNPEIPLAFLLAKESQLMISKLKELKLDDPSAPGMAVFGDNNNQIAILFGKVHDHDQTNKSVQAQTEKHLVISPKGFFLAKCESVAAPDKDILVKTLKDFPNVSIEGDCLKTSGVNNYQLFKLGRIEGAPEQFAQILKFAIESSRKVAQEPLLENVKRGQAGNDLLARMIQEKSQPAVAPPQPPFNS